MVLPDSHRVSRVPRYLGNSTRSPHPFAYRAFTLYGRPFQAVRLDIRFCNSSQNLQSRTHSPTTPIPQRLQPITRYRFRLFRVRSPLLSGITLFSFPRVTKMFQFTRCPPMPMYSAWVTRHYPGRVSPFGNLRIKACLQLPEAFRR